MEDRWATYICNINSEVASILLNASLMDDPERRKQQELLWIWVYLSEPRPDGLSSSEEAPTLYEIEEALEATLGESCDAILAGRITTSRRCEFYFYGKPAIEFEKAVSSALQQFPGYSYTFDRQADPEWQQYANVLYPSPEQWQSIGNQDVLDSLARNGDDHATARRVLHWAFFPTLQASEAFSSEAMEAGFELDKNYSIEGANSFSVCVSKMQDVLPPNIDRSTIALFRLAEKNNGKYDGWESQATSADDATA